LPPTIFSQSWDALDASSINAFLADEVDEGLLWEAKGDGRDPLGPHVIRKAVCGFANSERGGYLVVGAEKRDGRWQVVGLANPPDDLTTWLENYISTGVRPSPTHAIRALQGSDGPAAIVSIDPVDVPPALTSSGAMYERVSGATVPVTDPIELARLIAQGRSARSRAQSEARETVGQAMAHPPEPGTRSIYAVAVAPASIRGATSMMTADVYDAARRTLGLIDRFDTPRIDLAQTYFSVWTGNGQRSILCRATYGVATSFAYPEDENGIHILGTNQNAPLREAWEAIGHVLDAARVRGAGAIAVQATGANGTPEVVRPLDSLDVDLDLVASIMRELHRSQGRAGWEPT
jgi:hypothetical protein